MLEKDKDSMAVKKSTVNGNYLNLSADLYAQMHSFPSAPLGDSSSEPYSVEQSTSLTPPLDIPMSATSLPVSSGQQVGQATVALSSRQQVGQTTVVLPSEQQVGQNALSLPSEQQMGQTFHHEAMSSCEITQEQNISTTDAVQSIEMAAAPSIPQVSTLALELFQLLKSQNLLPDGQSRESTALFHELDTLIKQEQRLQQSTTIKSPSVTQQAPSSTENHPMPSGTLGNSHSSTYPSEMGISSFSTQGQNVSGEAPHYYSEESIDCTQAVPTSTVEEKQQESSNARWQVTEIIPDSSGSYAQIHNPLPPGASSGLAQSFLGKMEPAIGFAPYQDTFSLSGKVATVNAGISVKNPKEQPDTRLEHSIVQTSQIPSGLLNPNSKTNTLIISEKDNHLDTELPFNPEHFRKTQGGISSEMTLQENRLQDDLSSSSSSEKSELSQHDYISTPINPTQVQTFLKKDMQNATENGPMQMEANADALLKRILDIMLDAQDITQIALDCFFQGVVGVRIDHGTSVFYLATEDGGYMDSIRSNFSEKIEKTLEALGFHRFTVEILDKNQLSMPQKTIITEDGMHAFASYTFDNYVVGESNQVAHSYANKIASQEIAMNENPFFLYGDSGCGKTHLSCAIGNRKKELFPNTKIKYCTGSEYMESWVSALSNNTTEEFKRTYRNVDMLIMDDIQFLASAESTLKELFDTFDNFLRLQKQIIFSSDRSPEELKNSGFHARLTTRFQQGLVRKVESPDYELRRAIIRQKAKVQGLVLETTVEELIATNFSNDVRNLEGAIKQIHAYKDFMYTEYSKQGSPNTKAEQEAQTAAVMNFVKDLVQSKEVIVTPERIVEEVAKHFNLKPEQLKEQGRKAHIVNARNVAIFLMHSIMGLTYKEIGGILGGRDHTTILNSLNKINKQRSEGATEILNAIEYIEHSINSPG